MKNLKKIFNLQINKRPILSIIYGILLIILTVVCVVVIGNLLDHIPLIAAFDKLIYEAINLGAHPHWVDVLVAPFNFNFLPWGGTFIPSFLYFIFLLGFIYIAIFNRKEILFAILAVLIAMLIDTLLFKITNTYVFRDRPFVHLLSNMPESAKLIWAQWPTYPSGHVRDMALYSFVISGYAPKLSWLFVAVTLWVSYSRIYLGAHYFTDVLAGLALGYFVGFGILLMVKSFQHLVEGKKNKYEQND